MKRPLRRVRKQALHATAIPTFQVRRPGATADAIRWVVAPGRMPPGRRAYVIGDVHGERGRLAALHDQFRADLAARPVPGAVVIHLGDYIDQGPDGAGVIRQLRNDPFPGASVINLLGDHERMLLDALDGDRAAATDWLWAGGRATLVSWGLDPDLPREQWADLIPAAHVCWLRNLALSHRKAATFSSTPASAQASMCNVRRRTTC